MIRILHLADLHLGFEPKYLANSKKRRTERDQLLEKAVGAALDRKNHIDMVVIAGDLFEKYNPNEKLALEVIDQLELLEEQGIEIVTVPGNHDEITYKDSVYRKYADRWPGLLVNNPNPRYIESINIKNTEVFLYSCAYTGGITKPQVMEELRLVDKKGFHLGVFHGSLDWDGLGERSMPISSSVLGNIGFDYVALGHYHITMNKKVKNGLAVYPGAVEFKSFHDTGVGNFTVVNYDGVGATIETIKADVRQNEKIRIDVSHLENRDALIEQCKKYGDKRKFVKIELEGTPKFHIDSEDIADLIDKEFYYLEIEDNVQYFTQEFLDKIINEPTVRGIYVKRMKNRMESAESENDKKVIEMALLRGLAALEGGYS
jgi:DNA repair exonuclease SbcCD nuclease subunit